MSNITLPTDIDPATFLAIVEPQRRREEGELLLARFADVTGLPPVLWGKDLIGFGRYAYTYESGRSGEWFLTGFSPRKNALSVYIMPGYRDLGEPLARLGPHKLGKSCLTITNLARIDLDALDEIVRNGIDHMKKTYTTFER